MNPFDDNFNAQSAAGGQADTGQVAQEPAQNGTPTAAPAFSMDAPTQMQNGNQPTQGTPMGQQQSNGGFQQQQNNGYQQQSGGYQQPQQQQGGYQPQQQQGGYQQQSNGGGYQQQNGGYGGQQRKKYRIFDFFWFINPKLLQGQTLEENESAVLSVGYNCDFDNLRLTFYGNAQGALTPGAIVLEHLQQQKMAIGHVYPEARAQLMYMADNKTEGLIHCFERTIKQSQYTPNPTQINVTATEIQIKSTNSQSSQHATFNLTDWQRESFIKAVKTVTNCDSWATQINKL
jgi:hypothetical protein